MPPHARMITADDILPDAAFAQMRGQRRAELIPVKRNRRVALGPCCTFYFECFETMLFQVQEMLLVEKGGAEQLQDELTAYNPLIPQGDELVATVMFEIDNPVQRELFLGTRAGIEDRFQLRVGGNRITGIPEGDVDRSREDGKTSAVHFLRFRLSASQVAAFRDPAVEAMIACNDPRYAHMAAFSPATRAELSRDLAC